MSTNDKQVGLTVGQLCADFISAFGITGLSATSLAKMNKVFQLIQMGYLDEIKAVLREVVSAEKVHGKPKRADSIKRKKKFKRLLSLHSSKIQGVSGSLLSPRTTQTLYAWDPVNKVSVKVPVGTCAEFLELTYVKPGKCNSRSLKHYPSKDGGAVVKQ
jgi:hypothetical protein